MSVVVFAAVVASVAVVESFVVAVAAFLELVAVVVVPVVDSALFLPPKSLAHTLGRPQSTLLKSSVFKFLTLYKASRWLYSVVNDVIISHYLPPTTEPDNSRCTNLSSLC